MSEWFTGDVIANGIKTCYTRTGGDKPPLLMAHGASDNGLCWTRVSKVLQPDHDVIMYDARGHGLSDDGLGPRTREDMARDAAELIEVLRLDRPGMMGHSMGAATAATTAALFPDLLAYVILEDPPWFELGVRETWRTRRNAERAGKPEPETREEFVAQYRARYPNWHPDDLEPWVESKMQYKGRLGRTLGPQPPWQDAARRIACPALLITGDPDAGAIVTPELAEEAVTLMADARVVRIASAGHSIRRHRFEAYMDAVQAFLAEMRGGQLRG